MKLLDTCKSGFYHKIAEEFNASSMIFDEKVMIDISSLVLFPGNAGCGMATVLKMKISFFEAYKILGDIIRYAYTIPTLDYVQFLKVDRFAMYNLCSTVLKSYQPMPFEVEEICYYPRNHCFDVYIRMRDLDQDSKYTMRDTWSKIFRKLLKTEKCNLIIREKK